MMLRKSVLLVVIGLGFLAPQARAGFIGSMGLSILTPGANNADLTLANTFTLGTIQNNGNSTGGFSGPNGVPSGTSFGGGTFTLGNASALTFSNATYGMFQETVAPVVVSTSTINGTFYETFYILGNYSGGQVGASTQASVSFTFSQAGVSQAIGAGGTLQIPPAVVPEPASLGMMGLGLACAGVFAARRRSAK